MCGVELVLLLRAEAPELAGQAELIYTPQIHAARDGDQHRVEVGAHEDAELNDDRGQLDERNRSEQARRAALEVPPPLRAAKLEEQRTTEHHRVERHTGQERTIPTLPGDTPQLAQVGLEREEVEPATHRDPGVEPFGTGSG